MKVYISEYVRQSRDNRGQSIATGEEPPITTQVLTIGGASVQSAPFNSKTQFVRIHTDAICSIRFGENPVADGDSPRLAANQTEYFGIFPGHKVAVITNS